jgi:hypothetical protein
LRPSFFRKFAQKKSISCASSVTFSFFQYSCLRGGPNKIV